MPDAAQQRRHYHHHIPPINDGRGFRSDGWCTAVEIMDLPTIPTVTPSRSSVASFSGQPFCIYISSDACYHTLMSTYHTDPRVDQYIGMLPEWQQDICRRVRDLALAADPDVVETIKRTNRPYFTLNGNICALLAAKDHINVFIYDPLAPDPERIINQGHDNLTARSIQVRQGDAINERALLDLLRAVIANNRAGGWRKLKATR